MDCKTFNTSLKRLSFSLKGTVNPNKNVASLLLLLFIQTHSSVFFFSPMKQKIRCKIHLMADFNCILFVKSSKMSSADVNSSVDSLSG